jgi:hypothetical protein
MVPACALAQEEESAPPDAMPDLQGESHLQDIDSIAAWDAVPPHVEAPRWYSMITNIPGDWAGVGAAVVNPENFSTLAGIALATGGLILADHTTYTASHRWYLESPDVKFASNQIVRAGDGRATLIVAGAFALYGFGMGDNRALRAASGTVEALLASGITVQLLKRTAGRESPQVATRRNGLWHPFPGFAAYNRNQPRYYAFPSGHLTTEMATVTVIAENYPEAGWIRPLGYGIVGLTGVSLVNKGWHWYSDFPLALALGYTFGHLAAHHDDDRGAVPSPAGAGSFSVTPGLTREGAGVSLAFKF